MKLFLMRHAHPEQALNKPDIERAITELGRTESLEAANFLEGHQIDKIIISYALRTMQTGEIIRKKLPLIEVEIVSELYHEQQEDVLNLLSNQEDNNKHILVIGHNPLIYNLALQLADSNSSHFEFLNYSAMPPARIIIIDFPLINSWKELKNHPGHILEIFTPNTSAAFEL